MLVRPPIHFLKEGAKARSEAESVHGLTNHAFYCLLPDLPLAEKLKRACKSQETTMN